MTLFPLLFSNHSNASYWKVDYAVTYQTLTGMATLIMKKNELPTGGSCYIDQTNGTSLSTWFTIICVNWIDPDGSITKYEYLGIYKNIYLISLKVVKIYAF